MGQAPRTFHPVTVKCLPVGSRDILLVLQDLERYAAQEAKDAADYGSHNLDAAHLISQIADEHAEYRGTQDGDQYLRADFTHLWH